LAAHLGEPVAYLATGRATTPEMAARIRKHQQSRPPTWHTIEAPRLLASALPAGAQDAPAVLLEDLPSLVTTCLSGVETPADQLDAPELVELGVRRTLDAEVDAVIQWCASAGKHLVLVTSETGSGVLPHDPLDRLFKDLLGRLNARLARRTDGAFLVVAGMAVDLSALERQTLHVLGLPDRA
jgi:adenosylcobinamide kinase/adenosylcobinamide-phosphate guanylyltransferase